MMGGDQDGHGVVESRIAVEQYPGPIMVGAHGPSLGAGRLVVLAGLRVVPAGGSCHGRGFAAGRQNLAPVPPPGLARRLQDRKFLARWAAAG